jgi:4-diphosphocytidyl-2-C-methyl-D-erythritol kinase
MTVEEFAPAKVNLTLHVTGRRSDGYHLLDSLVIFVDAGDRLRAGLAEPDLFELQTEGAFGRSVPPGPDNLVLKAARWFERSCGAERGARLILKKELPPASGIGGGSADAAATLRALSRLYERPLPDAAEVAPLGADVPVCLSDKPQRMKGIGQSLAPVSGLPEFHLVLINPRVEVPTPTVFGGLEEADNAPMATEIPSFANGWDLVAWMHLQRNDLEAPAIAQAPVIRDVILALSRTPGCMLARMSGSGATCFGVYETAEEARAAAAQVGKAEPGWWVRAARPLGCPIN